MSSSDLRPGEFLAWLAASTAALVALLLVATWAVDPLGQIPASPRLCGEGIKIGNSGKALVAAARRPEEVLLGTSRVVAGFAGDDVRAVLGPRAANLALHAASLEEVDVLARNALAAAPVKRLWIGLDFAMFLPSPREARRFSLPAPRMSPRAAGWRYGLFDLNAVQATMLTAMSPGRCASPESDRDGFARIPLPSRASADDDLRFDLAGATLTLRSRAALPWPRGGYRERLRHLGRLAAEARRKGVETIVFVSPIHPLYAQAIREAGLEPLHSRWRADLRSALQDAQVVDLTGPALLPAECVRSSAPHCPFSDMLHFRPEIGRQVLLAATRRYGGGAARRLRPIATQ